MMTIQDVLWAYTEGRREYEELIAAAEPVIFRVEELYSAQDQTAELCGKIAAGDNLSYMLYLLKERQMAGAFQVIYADPPFLSNSKYQASIKVSSEKLGASPVMKIDAYDDLWREAPAEYLRMLTVRLLLMRDLLSEEGCIWVHLDWHAVHYVKILMDQIFGEQNFINEIIWAYKSGGASRRTFSRKHDTLLVYGKTQRYVFFPQKEKSYNRDMKPYHFKNVEEFQDERGWYTMVNMKDVWEIDMVGRTSAERTGYATQKPEKLMERIIASCSRQGDLCGDFFAGSGTLGAVCQKQGRRWIMCDAGKLATAGQISRMANLNADFSVERCSHVENGRFHWKIGADEMFALLEYIPADKEDFSMAEAHMDVLKPYLREDSLSLLQIWSIDLDYDGTCHRADKICTSGEYEISLQKRENGRIHIIGYDLWGNRIEQEVTISCT